MKTHYIFPLFLISFTTLIAQVGVKLSTNKIKVGEPIIFSISVEKEEKDSLQISPLDTIANFDILSIQDKTKDGQTIKEIEFTSYEEGTYTLPSFQVAINKNIYNTPKKQITIVKLKVDPEKQGIYNIKTIMPVSYSLWDHVQRNWIIGAILYLLLVFGFIIYMLYKKEKQIERELFKDLISPYDEAMYGLKKIKKYNILHTEDPKDLYVSLSFIVKRFIGRKYKINYAERLTEEFVIEIIENNILPKQEINTLNEFLAFADLVKFAKYQPKTEVKEINFNQISDLIERHKPLYNSNQEENV